MELEEKKQQAKIMLVQGVELSKIAKDLVVPLALVENWKISLTKEEADKIHLDLITKKTKRISRFSNSTKDEIIEKINKNVLEWAYVLTEMGKNPTEENVHTVEKSSSALLKTAGFLSTLRQPQEAKIEDNALLDEVLQSLTH